jgi:hypothetical protein
MRCTQTRYSLRLVLFAFISCSFRITEADARDQRDHLIPVDPFLEVADGAEYKDLYERKLFVTAGDAARFLYLPSFLGTERSVSVYRAVGKAGSLQGNYWGTATEASAQLSRCIPIPGEKARAVDPATIKVLRGDAPLPASTAQVVHQLWLAMLKRSRPRAEKVIMLDSTVLIFSATDSRGTLLRAQADDGEGNTAELWKISESLFSYCRLPASKRVEGARKLEQESAKLLSRIRRRPG